MDVRDRLERLKICGAPAFADRNSAQLMTSPPPGVTGRDFACVLFLVDYVSRRKQIEHVAAALPSVGVALTDEAAQRSGAEISAIAAAMATLLDTGVLDPAMIAAVIPND